MHKFLYFLLNISTFFVFFLEIVSNPTSVIVEGVWLQGNLKAMKTICVNPLSNVQTTKFHFVFNGTLLLEGKRCSIYEIVRILF